MRTMWLLILTTLTLALLGGCDTGKDDGDGPKSPHSDGKTDQIGQCQLDQDLVCRNSDGTFAKSDCCRVSCVVVDVDDA